MTVGKDHVPLTEVKLVRFNKKDMDLLEKAAKSKRLSIASLIRMAVFDYLGRETQANPKK